MNRPSTADCIEVMQAFIDGKPVEFVKNILPGPNGWSELNPGSEPMWDWARNTYRIKPLEKPSIDWSQIPDAYRWLAVDSSGCAYVYVNEPNTLAVHSITWFEPNRQYHRIDHIHASYKRGTVDWRDSLVERPE